MENRKATIAKSHLIHLLFKCVAGTERIKTAAKKLGTTQATISHYLYSKRGEKILKQLEPIDSVRSLADQIATRIATQNLSPVEAMLKFCELCKTLRTKDVVCDIHKRFIALPETCELCHG